MRKARIGHRDQQVDSRMADGAARVAPGEIFRALEEQIGVAILALCVRRKLPFIVAKRHVS